MKINLKLLHAFVLVAEHGSFRQAGEELGRSASAVSMQIKDLEGQLGIALFQRTTRHVELTPDGAKLLERVRRAMDDVQAGIADILDAVEQRKGRVRLASSPTVAASWLPGILATFRSRHPQIALSVRELVSSELLEVVRNQEVDFAIAPLVPKMPEFTFEPIIHDQIWALIPIGFDMLPPGPLNLGDLGRVPSIMLTNLTALRGTIESALAARGDTLNIRCEVQQVSTAIAMAIAGLGVAIVPGIAVPRPEPATLRVVPITGPEIFREIGVVTLKGQTLSHVAADLIALLKQTGLTAPGSTGAGPGSTPRGNVAG